MLIPTGKPFALFYLIAVLSGHRLTQILEKRSMSHALSLTVWLAFCLFDGACYG